MLLLDQDTGDRAVFGFGTKVGINIGNNTTPSYDLDVSGVGRFTGGVRFNDGTVQTSAGARYQL